jgi:cyclopropane fatty-acyl-phospholipid synthase-like methyltransferase
MNILHHYNSDHNTTSAKEIIPYIFGMMPEKTHSVLDIGCGIGQWLYVFKENGVETVLGIDGEHVPPEKIMVDKKSEFKIFDLKNIKNLTLEKPFDIALSLEVAEHLPKENAVDFVDFLTRSSDTVIFSAAVIGQTGENHVNEQNPDYWKELFKKNGYVMLDAFREKFWNNKNVNWWYRQNMYLFVKEKNMNLFPFKEYKNFYIHPELFTLKEKILHKEQKTKKGLFQKLKRVLIKVRGE